VSIVLKNKCRHDRSRVVSIDYGTKRVGLSVADPLRLFAQPFGVYSPASAVEKLVSFHHTETIGTIVIGWPLNEDGSEGKATRRVENYIRQLSNRLPDTKIIRWDERHTSEEAKARLSELHIRPEAGEVDQMAASIILQEFLDAHSETTRVNERS